MSKPKKPKKVLNPTEAIIKEARDREREDTRPDVTAQVVGLFRWARNR